MTPGGIGNGPIEPGDIVSVQFFDEPELSFRAEVSKSGQVYVPLLGAFHLTGMSTIDATQKLGEELVTRGLFIAPHLAISVQEVGLEVTIIGEVRAPGVYRVRGQRTILQVLALAGGLTDHAGQLIQVNSASGGRRLVRFDQTLRKDVDLGLSISPGDSFEVSSCGVIYVGGNVQRPGGYPICAPGAITVSQAVALAGGQRPSSKTNSTILVHTDNDGKQTVTYLHLEEILNARRPDPLMQQDDVLYIPESILKTGAKLGLQAAVGFASQAIVYGAINK